MTKEFDRILRLFHPRELLHVRDIQSRLETQIPVRTLQRQLSTLVDRGFLMREGQGRATRYYRVVADDRGQSPDVAAGSGLRDYLSYIPVSEEGREILATIRRPLAARQPVSYDRALLDNYLPGDTFYLKTILRKHLHALGRTDNESLPAGTYGRQILDRLLIDLSFGSSRLEGNTYSLLETERLLASGIAADGKDAVETQMILNHKKAVEMLVDQAEELGFNSYTLLNLHAILSDNLLPDPFAGGRLRRMAVQIGGSVYLPTEVPQTIEEMFELLLNKAELISDPFEQAFFVLVHIPYLQPFDDVNKRVARMAANIPLIRKNLCPLTFLDVPPDAYVDGTLGVYELQKMELLKDVFVWAYERSTQRYMQVKKTTAAPDPVRLRYREQMYDIVRSVVAGEMVSYSRVVKERALRIPETDREVFTEMVLEEIKRLHEGSIARYGIRPMEFRKWKARRFAP